MNASEQEVALLPPELAVAVKYKWLLRGHLLDLGRWSRVLKRPVLVQMGLYWLSTRALASFA